MNTLDKTGRHLVKESIFADELDKQSINMEEPKPEKPKAGTSRPEGVERYLKRLNAKPTNRMTGQAFVTFTNKQKPPMKDSKEPGE